MNYDVDDIFRRNWELESGEPYPDNPYAPEGDGLRIEITKRFLPWWFWPGVVVAGVIVYWWRN